jgi:serine/threonine-protein kinase
MKHVREGLPDVQKRRPETSAALAAVVERAAAKEIANRYRSISEMIEELEQVLTYETARAGDENGEATAVLRQLQPERRRFSISRLHLRPVFFGLAIVAVAVVAGILIERKGGSDQTTVKTSELSTIKLGDHDANDYDPPPGDGQENASETAFALDGDPSTAWETERYDSPDLGNIKDGVGLYLDAGRPVVARALRITSPAKDWDFELYVANSVPGTVADWTKVSSGTMDTDRTTASLDTGGQRFQYYLIWITKLAPRSSGGYGAAISEVRLLG